MATTDVVPLYKHDKVKVKYSDRKEILIRISKKPDKYQSNLDLINKKIEKKWKLNHQYKLSINDIIFTCNDVEQFTCILSRNKPMITITVIQNNSNVSEVEKNNHFMFNIHYKTDNFKYPFPLDIETWNDQLFDNMIDNIKQNCNINPNMSIVICEDETGELELDEIDNLKLLFEDVDDSQLNPQFTMDLYIKLDPSDDKTPECVDHKDNNDEIDEDGKDMEEHMKYNHSAVVHFKVSKVINISHKKHRIYFLGKNGTGQISVHFPDLSAEYHKMEVVSKSMKHLVYLDVNIPWESNRTELQIGFKFFNSKKTKWNTFMVEQKFIKNCTAYFYMEQKTQILATINMGDNKSTLEKISKYILIHMVADVTDWKSFNFSWSILKDVCSSIHMLINKDDAKKLFGKQTATLYKNNMTTVYKMVLIKKIVHKKSSSKGILDMYLKQLYNMVECCLMDKSLNGLIKLHQKQFTQLACIMYEIFYYDIHKLLLEIKSVSDIVLMHPVFNLFKYFESFVNIHRKQVYKKQLLFQFEYRKDLFIKDTSRRTLKLLNILKTDLKVGEFTTRIKPFEILAVQLYWALYRNKNTINDFMDVFKEISCHKKNLSVNFSVLFNDAASASAIFSLLDDNWQNWSKIIELMTTEMILSNKTVTNVFREYFCAEMETIKSLSNVNLMFEKYRKIFDTVHVRIAILENHALIKEEKDDDKLSLNLAHIMQQISINSDKSPFKDSIELIEAAKIFMITFLKKENITKRNTFFRIFGENKYWKKSMLKQCFEHALFVVMKKYDDAADKMMLFLKCSEFYDVYMDSDIKHNNTIHDYFISKVLEGKNAEIEKWNDAQIKNIQKLIKQFAGKGDQLAGISLWNKILENVMVLPLDDDKFVNRLNHCIYLFKWIKFASDMHHIDSFYRLNTFCTKQLNQLNNLTKTQNIKIKCVELVKREPIKLFQLISDCGYKMEPHMLQGIIDRFNELQELQKYLDVFLTNFTSPQDEITQRTAEFVQFVNNWDEKTFKVVVDRKEWKEYEKYTETLQYIANTPSQIFRQMWFHGRNDIKVEWNLDQYINKLYPIVYDHWIELVKKIKQYKLKIDDIKWFDQIESIDTELTALGFKKATLEKVKPDIYNSKMLLESKDFFYNLVKIVGIFKNTFIFTELNKEWERFESNVRQLQKLNNNTQIKAASDLYLKLSILQQKFSELQGKWISATVSCKKSVNMILNSAEFKGEFFSETLQLLTDSGSNEYVELSGSLNKVQKQWSSVLQQSFKNEKELALYFSKLSITQNDIDNILQVHNALTDIKQIVLDAGKHAKVRDKQRLDKAMNNKNSFFTFKISDNNNENKSIQEIARDALILEYFDQDKNKLIQYTCDQIENMIDVILLSKCNYNIDNCIKKMDICKEISELRIKCMIKGGRIEHQNEVEQYQKIPATLTLRQNEEKKEEINNKLSLTFEEIRNFWEEQLKQWTNNVLTKRNDEKSDQFGHIFNYFTMNTIRIIIDKLNEHKRSNDDVMKKILFREILCYFRFINPDIKEWTFIDIIPDWKFIESSYDKSFEIFKDCFERKEIINKHKRIEYNDISEYINYSQPNLLIQNTKKDAFFSSLKLFVKNQNNVNILPYQYLICDAATSYEHIEIFLNRCLQNKYRHDSLNGYPLFCLMFPEDLNISVLDDIDELFQTKLLMSDHKLQNYALIVISCNDTNSLSNLLQNYKIRNGIGDRNKFANVMTRVYSAVFNIDNIFRSNKIFVQLYRSYECGQGKSFMIQKKAFMINKYCDNLNKNLIRIPFNEPNIDLDFVVSRLNQCYEHNIKMVKIIYHVDISSSSSDTINSVLFKLLFLKYISTPKNNCFSIRNEMAFLIELPSKLSVSKISNDKKFNNQMKNTFYLLHEPMRFNVTIVDNTTNPFQYDINCRYAAKFLQYFYSNKLKTEDPDPGSQIRKITNTEIEKILNQYFPRLLYLSKTHQKSFWQYLYTQFYQVVSSTLLRNDLYDNKGRMNGIRRKYFSKRTFSEWKHLTTSSIIDLALDFATNINDESSGYYMKNMDMNFIDESKFSGNTNDQSHHNQSKFIDNNDIHEVKDMDESKHSDTFHLVQKWKQCSKPIVLLNQSIDGSISFLISDTLKFIASSDLNRLIKSTLETFKFDLLDWKQLQNNPKSKRNKLKLLLKIIGNPINDSFDSFIENSIIEYSAKGKWIKGKVITRVVNSKNNFRVVQLCTGKKQKNYVEKKDKSRAYCPVFSDIKYCDYVLTYDNMLKMIAIYFRIKADTPVILIGETGCGKTFLLDYLAKASNIEIKTVNVHGGYAVDNIRKDMKEFTERAIQKLEQHDDIKEQQHEWNDTDLWIFFDEINTSSILGYFKEIICDKSFDGRPLPSNIKIIAACNPYRKRNMKNIKDKSILNDPLSHYMYRVYPLPQTMKLYVWKFGNLEEKAEQQYIEQMTQSICNKLTRKLDSNQQKKLYYSIHLSQKIVRSLLQDSAFVSLRDVVRTLQIFQWQFSKMKLNNDFEYALWEALAISYNYRLNQQNQCIYWHELSQHINIKFQAKRQQCDRHFETLFKEITPKGIAWNQTLKENLFLLLTCIQTKIPLILVGKPGSSKSLAMSIITDLLSRRTKSRTKLLQQYDLKPIHIVSFQCSAQSKAAAIKNKWEQAQALAEKNKDTIYVLLLDEIGLAETSTQSPLKVLHQLLEMEPAPISFVGLSNWPLDAAKMNRVVMHQCYQNSGKDLIDTARAMAVQFYDSLSIEQMESRFCALSGIYHEIINNNLQPRDDFFGARDYYGVIRHFLGGGSAASSTNKEFIVHFLRNFGGIDYQHVDLEEQSFQKSFHKILKDNLSIQNYQEIRDVILEFNPATLVDMNLNDKRLIKMNDKDAFSRDNFALSRHIMVITEYSNSWNVLMDLNILTHENVFIFKSQFDRDKSNIYLYLNHVRNCMETGKTLLLYNLPEIHESLYDMLNQRYVFRKTDNKMYCRIALASNSETCFVDKRFKCIVITTKKNAYSPNGTPIAFLNRFEKQLISYYSALSPQQLKILSKLRNKLTIMYDKDEIHFHQIFPGYCKDTLPSIIIKVWNMTLFKKNEDKLVDEVIKRLFLFTSTESLIKMVTYHVENQTFDKYKDLCVDTLLILKDVLLKKEDCLDINDVHSSSYNDLAVLTVQKEDIKEEDDKYDNDVDDEKYTFIQRQNGLTIALTYEFAFTLNHHLSCLATSKIKAIGEFRKVDHFEKYIKQFLTTNDKVRNLILCYKHRSNKIDHFVHIKHIILSSIDKYPSEYKQIIVIVHLNRNDNLSLQFPLIVGNSYKTIYLDSLSQTESINVNLFVTQTLTDICISKGISIICENNIFQRALANLNFVCDNKQTNNNVSIKKQIENLSKILSIANCKQEMIPLQQCIFDRFINLLSHSQLNQSIAKIVCNWIDKHKDWAKGSFYERLNDIINSVSIYAITHILQLLYTNNNMNTMSHENEEKSNEIIDLFINLYRNYQLIEEIPIVNDIHHIVEDHGNESLQVSFEYQNHFPFSNIVSEWINSTKSLIVNNKLHSTYGVELKSHDADKDNDTDNNDDLKEIFMSNKQLFHTYQTITNNELKKLNLGILSHSILELYAQDILQIYRDKLNIDNSTSPLLIKLSAKFLVMICSVIKQSDLITIADLECTIWTQHPLLLRINKILSIVNEDKLDEIDVTFDSKYKIEMLVENIKLVLWYLFKSLQDDHSKYQLCILYSIEKSILYIINFIKSEHNNNCQPLIEQLNCIKFEFIVIKNKLNEPQDDISEVMENQSLLLEYTVLSKYLRLLIEQIPDNIDKSKQNELCNALLCDLLTLVDNEHVIKSCNQAQKDNFYQFLIDLLTNPENIVDAQLMNLTSNTQYRILLKLFALFWNTSVKIENIISKIQQKNEKFANVIIEIMSKQNENYCLDFNKIQIKFVDKEVFHCTYTIQTPLILSRNQDLRFQFMRIIGIDSFFQFLQQTSQNQSKYPILYKLTRQRQSSLFWNIQNLPPILLWIKLIHSKYNSTLSQESCNNLNINDVFEAAKYNKWGDIKQWNQKWETFAKHWNNLRLCNNNVNINEINDAKKSNSIYSSLIGSKHNETLKNNMKCIQQLINTQNEFLNDVKSININIFDINSYHLIDTASMVSIILKYSEPWICYNVYIDKESKLYIKFDLNKIEKEIYNQCIAGRYRLNVTFNDFEFISNNNTLKAIQNLQIKQEILNFETWQLFDQQFETNIQRKKVVRMIENVICLLVSFDKNKQNNQYLDDEKYNINDVNTTLNRNSNYGDTILWTFMEKKLLLFLSNEYPYFKIDEIKIKHIQDLWHKLVQRTEDKMKQYSTKCYICLDSIDIKPSINLECCSLSIHYNCLKEEINSKFIRNNGKKVTLKQLSCSICRKQMKNKQIQMLFEPINKLYDKVKNIALLRLKYDKKENDFDVVNNYGSFYDDKIGYAMKLYSIFICYNCTQPFYGGLNNCIDDMDEKEEKEQINEDDYSKERLCNKCIPIKKFDTTCSIHGDEFIQWKCQFCCSVATFYCFGTTHFCQYCHCKAYTLKGKDKNKLIQCPSKCNPNTKLPEKLNGDCPLGFNMKHSPNGQEYCLGCALCRK